MSAFARLAERHIKSKRPTALFWSVVTSRRFPILRSDQKKAYLFFLILYYFQDFITTFGTKYTLFNLLPSGPVFVVQMIQVRALGILEDFRHWFDSQFCNQLCKRHSPGLGDSQPYGRRQQVMLTCEILATNAILATDRP
jgi:hypothetical protein